MEDIYRKEYMQAKANFDDLQERRMDAIGENALEFIDTLLTEEEINESDLRVARIKPKKWKKATSYEIAFFIGYK